MLDALRAALCATIALSCLVCASACSSEDRPPSAVTGSTLPPVGSLDQRLAYRSGSPCATEATVACRVYLRGYSVPVCYEGVQRCVDGVWSPCERLDERGGSSESEGDGGAD